MILKSLLSAMTRPVFVCRIAAHERVNNGFESRPRFISLGIEVNMKMAAAFVETGIVVCGFLGYWLGAYVACYWLYPGS